MRSVRGPALEELHAHAERPALADTLALACDEREREAELDPDWCKLIDEASADADARPRELGQSLLDVGRVHAVLLEPWGRERERGERTDVDKRVDLERPLGLARQGREKARADRVGDVAAERVLCRDGEGRAGPLVSTSCGIKTGQRYLRRPDGSAGLTSIARAERVHSPAAHASRPARKQPVAEPDALGWVKRDDEACPSRQARKLQRSVRCRGGQPEA
jgi:hypothetical protein